MTRRTILVVMVALLALAIPSVAQAQELDVGHTIKRIVVPGSTAGELRQVDVHLWYPADEEGLRKRGKAEYTSRLWHDKRVTQRPLGWVPLSWKVEAEIAREGANIDPNGAAFPVIVFSHGATNDPIDYAHTLELIASAGFVVAAPQHVNNSQDDVRIDYVNTQAGTTLIPCNDGLPSPCSRGGTVPRSMRDRARDISSVLNRLREWFGNRVDLSRAGVMGHSRGTVTALAAAGGSTFWGFAAEPRVKAIMGLAIGVQNITDKVDLANVTVPTLLVAGTLDETSPPAVSQFALDQITSTDKALVSIENARHRSFDSTYCDQTQAAGAIVQPQVFDEQGNVDLTPPPPPAALLDLHTVTGIVAPGTAGGAGTSGRATEFCNSKTFEQPEDIRPLVTAITDFNFATQNVPTTGLDTNDVKEQVKELAATFFGRVLR